MTINPVWEETFRSRSWGKYPGEDLIRFVARNFYSAERSKITLLEVGCGPGANLWYMAREGFTVVGIDGSPTAIEQARSRLSTEIPHWRGQLFVGDVQTLPLPDASIDAVIDNECVCCNDWEESQAIYREIARVLKSGGQLFARTFAPGCWGEGTGKRIGRGWECTEGLLADKGIVRFTRREEIPALLGNLTVTHLEMASRTYENQAHVMHEWIIHAVK